MSTMLLKTLPIQDNTTLYLGDNWNGLSGVNVVQLSPTEYNTFGGVNPSIRGYILANPDSGTTLIENTDFVYDEYIDTDLGINIYDTNNDGPFDAGKYIRIVQNGQNIANPAGMNLRIRAKRLEYNISPPANECYIDPTLGKFMLPGPYYWSKCESVANMTTQANMSDRTSEVIWSSGTPHFFGAPYAKWNQCAAAQDNEYFLIKPTNELGFNKGTISMWINGYYYSNFLGTGQSPYYAGITIGGSVTWTMCVNAPGTIARCTPTAISPWGLWINGNIISLFVESTIVNQVTFTAPTTLPTVPSHLYVLWDTNAGIGGASIKVYWDTTLVYQYNSLLTDTFGRQLYIGASGGYFIYSV